MPMRLGQLEIHPELNEISGPDGRERLEPQAMAVLELLAEEAGRVWSRDELLERAWPGRVVSDATLTGVVSRLRRGLKAAGVADVRIETRSKRGYRLLVNAPAHVENRQRAVRALVLSISLALVGLLAWQLLEDVASVPSPDRYLRVEFSIRDPAGELLDPTVVLESGSEASVAVGNGEPLQVKVRADVEDGGTVRMRYEIAALSEWGMFEFTTPYRELNRFRMPAGRGGYDISVQVSPVSARSTGTEEN